MVRYTFRIAHELYLIRVIWELLPVSSFPSCLSPYNRMAVVV